MTLTRSTARGGRRGTTHPLGRALQRHSHSGPRRRLTLAGAGIGALGVVGLVVARRGTGPDTAVDESSTAPGATATTDRGPATGPANGPGYDRQDSPSRPRQDRSDDEHRGPREPRRQGRESSSMVRSRPMWIGVLLLIAGMLVTGWAVWKTSTAWAVAGVAVLAVGGALAWWGGILADVQGGRSLKEEAAEAVKGEQHRGVDAGDEIWDPDARRTAKLRDRRKDVLQARAAAPPARWQPVAKLALLVLGVWLAAGVFVLGYPYSSAGQNGVNRAIGAGVALVLCWTWLRNVGRSRVAAGLAAVVGTLLLLAAFLLDHDRARIVYQEGAVGALTVLAAGIVFLGRPR
ncbi:MAG: hypothetical protein ACLGH4_06715 [Actinomycetes bacterium]